MITARDGKHVEPMPGVVDAELRIELCCADRRVPGQARSRPAEVVALRMRIKLALNTFDSDLFRVVVAAVEFFVNTADQAVEADTKFVHHPRSENVRVADRS